MNGPDVSLSLTPPRSLRHSVPLGRFVRVLVIAVVLRTWSTSMHDHPASCGTRVPLHPDALVEEPVHLRFARASVAVARSVDEDHRFRANYESDAKRFLY